MPSAVAAPGHQAVEPTVRGAHRWAWCPSADAQCFCEGIVLRKAFPECVKETMSFVVTAGAVATGFALSFSVIFAICAICADILCSVEPTDRREVWRDASCHIGRPGAARPTLAPPPFFLSRSFRTSTAIASSCQDFHNFQRHCVVMHPGPHHAGRFHASRTQCMTTQCRWKF